MSACTCRTYACACYKQSCDLSSPVPALPSLKALTALNLSSNQKVGGVVHSLVSALPLKQMKHLPLNSCRLDEESFTALGTHTHNHTQSHTHTRCSDCSGLFSSSGSRVSINNLCGSSHTAEINQTSLFLCDSIRVCVCVSSGGALPVQCGRLLV